MGSEELGVVVSTRVHGRRANWKLNDDKFVEEAIVLVVLL